MPSDDSNSRGLIRRERGDDVYVLVKFRRSAFVALTEGDGLKVDGIMQLVPDSDAHSICVWSRRMPDWPDPVPGNAAAAAERSGDVE